MLTKGGQTRIEFLEEIAARSGRPVVVAALLHSSTNPDAVFHDLDLIGAAHGRGRKLVGAISCCPLTMDFTLAAPYPFEGLAAWKPALGEKGEAFKRVIADRSFRDAIRAELARPATFRLFNGEWDRVLVVEAARPEHRALENKSLAQIGTEQGKHPLDALLDLALAEDLETRVRRAAAQRRGRRGAAPGHPSAQPRVAVGRRGAPHVLQRRRLRAASARALGP